MSILCKSCRVLFANCDSHCRDLICFCDTQHTERRNTETKNKQKSVCDQSFVLILTRKISLLPPKSTQNNLTAAKWAHSAGTVCCESTLLKVSWSIKSSSRVQKTCTLQFENIGRNWKCLASTSECKVHQSTSQSNNNQQLKRPHCELISAPHPAHFISCILMSFSTRRVATHAEVDLTLRINMKISSCFYRGWPLTDTVWLFFTQHGRAPV